MIEPNLRNPHYAGMSEKWDVVATCYVGTDAVKSGPLADGFLPIQNNELMEKTRGKPVGRSQYELRKSMATFENFFRPIVDDITGIMQKNPPKIAFGISEPTESPQEVRDIEFFGNRHNDGLKGLKWRLNAGQVLFGRYGLLLDIRANADGLEPQFCISEYPAQKILDGEMRTDQRTGNDSLRWVLLDESSYQYDEKEKQWEQVTRLRVLGVDGVGRYYQSVLSGDSCHEDWRDFDFASPPEECTVYPLFKQRTLGFIPFTACNTTRLGIAEWQDPPYLDVAHIALAAYQVDSWYKTAIRKHASPTLAICNASSVPDELYLGDMIRVSGSGQNMASVSLLETSASGLAEMRNAKNSLKESLRYSSIRDLLDGAGANSSGEAIQLRTASGTAFIAAVDNAGARAIEEQLVYAAIWAGATQREAGDRISYDADTSYLDNKVQLQAVVAMLQANQATGLLSSENMYNVMSNALPGVLSSYDDNEVQKAVEMEGEL